MDGKAEEGFRSVPVDLGSISATIALASDALAAAAEALAEASRAISDASDTYKNINLPTISTGIAHYDNAPQGPNYSDDQETNCESRDLQSQTDQHGLSSGQFKLRFEHGIPATSSPARSWISLSSDSSSELELVPLLMDEPLEEPIWSSGSRREINDDIPEQGLNNTLDTLPPSPVVLASNESRLAANWSVADGTSHGPQSSLIQSSRPENLAKPEPRIPSGRNYIHLEHESDVFAFIAYITQQVHRIICLVPDQLMETCQKLLQSHTNANVHCVGSFKHFQSLSAAFGAIPKPDSCNVMLVSPFFMNFLSSSRISPDYVLHWGQPASTYRWVNQVLYFLPPAVKVCVMLVGERSFNEVAYGVAPYSDVILATLHNPNSPFQAMRQIFSQFLLRVTSGGSQAISQRPNPRPLGSPSSSASISTHDWVVNTNTSLFGQPLAAGLPMLRGPKLKELRLIEAMKSQPDIPSGRNYIQLNTPTDALAFIAYMALQAHRVVCVVPRHRQDACAKLLKLISHANIYLIDTPKQYDDLSATPGAFSSTSYDILLTPCSEFTLNARWVLQSNPDCILHWSQPANVYYYTTRHVVESLPRIVRTCVLVVGESIFDGKAHGVEPYHPSVLKQCFRSGSPVQLLRQFTPQLVPVLPTAQAPSRTKAPNQTPNPRPSQPPSSHKPVRPSGKVPSLPAGHHYIVLDQADEIDIISITAYLALNSRKVMCHIPDDKDLIRYQTIMNQIDGVDTIAPTVLKGKPFEQTLKSFKSRQSGVWLRTASAEWNSFWSKSLVDCAIYWGVPLDLANCKRLSLRVHTKTKTNTK